MVFQFKLRDLITKAETPAEFIANGGLSIAAQSVLGAYSVASGSGAICDGILTSNFSAKSLYFAGGTLQLASGVCLLGNSLVSSVCPPIGVVTSAVGYALNQVGNHIIDNANSMNSGVSITKLL